MQDPAPKEPLSRETIAKAALSIADIVGIENVSVRKVASALDRTPMALYRHFGSMAEIQQAALALAYEAVDTKQIAGERWDDTIRRVTSSIRQVHLDHPNAHLHLVEGNAWDPGLRAHTEKVQSLHSSQNIPEEILSKTWRIIDAFLTGFIINEAEEPAAHHLQESDTPAWIKVADDAYSDEAFRDGIEIIIQGIKGLAAPDPCEWKTPEDHAG